MTSSKTLRTCKNGHQYYKSSDCPVCPVCEKERNTVNGFSTTLSAPARRALEREGIRTLLQLSKYSEKELLALHGFGPSAIPKLKALLRAKKLTFKK